MIHRHLLCGCVLACLFSSAQAANDVPSRHRSALLLGNSKYEGFTLDGVAKSLDEVEQTLKSLGFRVQRHENLKQDKMEASIDEFAQTVPTGAVAVVYYAGLGAYVERLGKSYNLLRPVGEKIESDNDYRSRGLDVSDLIEAIQEKSGSSETLVFLDACWESPIRPESGSIHGGMREFDVPADTMVIFAADSGKTLPTPDGDGASAFSEAIGQHAQTLNSSVDEACQAITADLDGAWFGGVIAVGIGTPSRQPMIDALREGKSPGEGFVNSVGMTFRWCPPGSFTMGSKQTDTADTRDREPVEVTLSKGFWMGQHEVTQREYNVVMRKTLPPTFTIHKNAPFWGVTESKQIDDFCKKLTEMDRKAGTLPDGWEYACPTEAQWEYACRAGSTGRFCFGDSAAELGDYANFADKALKTANANYHWAHDRADDGVAEALAPVGSYKPNAWGLRDMHGNVAEIVADHLLPELPGGTDPLARLEKNGVTQIRGGAWCSLPLYCESSFRNAAAGRDKHNFIGFRIVLKRK